MKGKIIYSNSIGPLTLLFLVFLVLKLAKVTAIATWSWWWVCSPIWIPIALVLSVAFIYLLVEAIYDTIKKPK